MKQIQEKYLVLIAAFFALLIGAYTFYSVITIVAQTTTDDGTVSTDTASSSTTNEDSIDKSDPPPEEDLPRTDPPPEEEPNYPSEEDTTTKTEDDFTTTTEDEDTADATKDTNDSDDTTSRDDGAVYTEETTSSSSVEADHDTLTQDTSTVDYYPDDASYTTKADGDIIKLQENPYIDFSTETVEVNVKEYMEHFVTCNEAEEIFRKKQHELNEQEQEKLRKIKKEAILDSDADGIPDYEEYRLGTNIFSADTDNDGFKDGDEIKNGYNPRKFSAGEGSDRISFQDPEDVKETSPIFKVTKTEFQRVAAKEEALNDKLELAGTALPNSIVTIYIYSDPIVVTIQADNDGNWYYVLDKELEEGEHKVYAAVTDSTGKVTTRSEGLAFVKTAKALDLADQEVSELETQMVSPVKKAQSNMTKIGLLVAIISVILAILSIGYFIKTKGSEPKAKNDDEVPREYNRIKDQK